MSAHGLDPDAIRADLEARLLALVEDGEAELECIRLADASAKLGEPHAKLRRILGYAIVPLPSDRRISAICLGTVRRSRAARRESLPLDVPELVAYFAWREQPARWAAETLARLQPDRHYRAGQAGGSSDTSDAHDPPARPLTLAGAARAQAEPAEPPLDASSQWSQELLAARVSGKAPMLGAPPDPYVGCPDFGLLREVSQRLAALRPEARAIISHWYGGGRCLHALWPLCTAGKLALEARRTRGDRVPSEPRELARAADREARALIAWAHDEWSRATDDAAMCRLLARCGVRLANLVSQIERDQIDRQMNESPPKRQLRRAVNEPKPND